MKFKDVAHLYLGCRMVNESVYERSIEQGKPYKPHLFKMVSNDGSFWVSREQDSRNLETTALKPILRRQSSLTDEEYQNIDRIQRTAKEYEYQVWVYLLSIGIDLFGLIDAGEAIDAQTLEAQP